MVRRKLGLLAILGPGILVAATGLGAGDIASAGFAGSHLGYTILWAALLGAFIKFVVNEGLMRWQLATGQTLLEGSVLHFGRVVQWFFLAYLLVWSLGVGSALISACGVAGHALIPVFDDPQRGRVVFGIAHSLIALVLILLGGYQRFEKVMASLLGLMFVSVIATALVMNPPWAEVARGMILPRIPTDVHPEAGQWTLALMGGVGGTLTMLCYGYWIREQGRVGPGFLKTCRIDLLVSYGVTAIFGVSMVIIGSSLDLAAGGGAGLMVKISAHLGQTLGAWARWVFLIGGWAAMFTSLLGVWQAVPYLFADFWRLFRGHGSPDTSTAGNRAVGGFRDGRIPGESPAGEAHEAMKPLPAGAAVSFAAVIEAAPLERERSPVDTRSWVYRGYLFALAFIPMAGLQLDFVMIQKTYSMLGAVVMPLLALALLILNGRRDLVGVAYRNRPLTVAVLLAVLVFFIYAGIVTFLTGRAVIS
jgi:Mn2+/Fe2+ NRAMP family transporter